MGNGASTADRKARSSVVKKDPLHQPPRSEASSGTAGSSVSSHVSASSVGSQPNSGMGTGEQAQPRRSSVMWVLMSYRPPDRELAHGILASLEDNGQHIRGGDAPADATPQRLRLISQAAVFLAIVGPAFEKSKKAKQEFLHAVSCDVPVAVVLTGPMGYRPKASWLRSAVASGQNVTDFQKAEDFNVNMAMLQLQLNPSNFTELARELSSVAHDALNDPVDVKAVVLQLKSKSSGSAQLRESRRGLRQLIGAALTESKVQEILNAGGVEAVLDAMRRLAKNADIATYGTWVLMHMASKSRVAADAIVAADGPKTFCNLADRYPSDPTLQHQCCLALFYLAQHGVGVSVTGVRVAATAIRTHDKDGTVLLSALRAMHQTFSIAISRNLDNVTSALLDERVRAAILALEPRYNNDTAVGKSARAFLNDLNNHR